MATIRLNGRAYNINLIALDKDGTLVDFDNMWGKIYDRWLTALITQVGGTPALRVSLEKTLGFDAATAATVPDSPFAVASFGQINIVAATVLHQHGLGWHAAQTAVNEVNQANPVVLSADLVQPLGNVAAAVNHFRQVGVQVAVITSDDRKATEESLAHLGIAADVALLVCGDDPIPNKPAPDGLWHISRTLGVARTEMMMVGDSAGDMACGRAAGVACCVAVAPNAATAERLRPAADALINSIDELIFD